MNSQTRAQTTTETFRGLKAGLLNVPMEHITELQEPSENKKIGTVKFVFETNTTGEGKDAMPEKKKNRLKKANQKRIPRIISPGRNLQKHFFSRRLPDGIMSAKDAQLEPALECCESCAWFFAGLVVIGVAAEVVIAA